jgi:hypothetical protein
MRKLLLSVALISGLMLPVAHAQSTATVTAAASEEVQIARLLTEAPDLHELFSDERLPSGRGLAKRTTLRPKASAVERNVSPAMGGSPKDRKTTCDNSDLQGRRRPSCEAVAGRGIVPGTMLRGRIGGCYGSHSPS